MKLSTFVVAVVLSLQPASLVAQQTIVNNDATPLMVANLTGSDGTPHSRLYVPAKGEMVLGQDGWPAAGAGYIEALEGRTYYVPFAWEGPGGKTSFGGLRARRIEWDKAGRLVAIAGLQRVFESDPPLQISSDTAKPKILEGVLYLKFTGKGDVEYQFKTSFGKGVMFSLPAGFR